MTRVMTAASATTPNRQYHGVFDSGVSCRECESAQSQQLGERQRTSSISSSSLLPSSSTLSSLLLSLSVEAPLVSDEAVESPRLRRSSSRPPSSLEEEAALLLSLDVQLSSSGDIQAR